MDESGEIQEFPRTLVNGATAASAAPRGVQSYYIVALLGLSLALNVYLGLKIQFRNHVAAPLVARPALSEGDNIAPIAAHDLNGSPISIRYADSDKPTVLYVFSPSCSWCGRNAPAIAGLVALRGPSYKFIGLSLTSERLREYVKYSNFGFPVFTGAVGEYADRLEVGGTPQTLVISPSGKVLKDWTGAYMGQVREEVESYFGVRLPELSAADAPVGGPGNAFRH
ncbi:MAG TPA: TlpA disulfide reductase family protein [Blastocatellia bacterium]